MFCSLLFHSGLGVGCSWRHSQGVWKVGKGSHYFRHILENCPHFCSRLKSLSFLRYLAYCNKWSQRTWLSVGDRKSQVSCLQVFKRIYLFLIMCMFGGGSTHGSAHAHREQRLLDLTCCLTWVLGTERRSSVKTAHALNKQACVCRSHCRHFWACRWPPPFSILTWEGEHTGVFSCTPSGCGPCSSWHNLPLGWSSPNISNNQ